MISFFLLLNEQILNIMNMENKSTELDNTDKKLIISDVSKRYSSVIADIYAEHHVNPFTDIQKHNDGIIKAMVDFAIFYKEHSSL